jgi:hypothetical protein
MPVTFVSNGTADISLNLSLLSDPPTSRLDECRGLSAFRKFQHEIVEKDFDSFEYCFHLASFSSSIDKAPIMHG